MRSLAVVLLAVATLAMAGCRPGLSRPADTASAAPAVSGHLDRVITVDGRSRTYHLYVPPGVSRPAPLVVMLHGGFGDGRQAEMSYGWDAQADAGRFAVVYPDGVSRAWNVGGGCCGIPASSGLDDVAFIAAVVGDIARTLPIDPRRVYATGISNGGLLAYRLACDTKLFAAIGPDSATLLGPCPSPAPISVIHIHGAADRNIPYDGGPGDGFAKIDGPAVPSVIADWRRVDQCGAASQSASGVVTTSVATCPGGRAVELITIAGAGHQWPGSPQRPAIEKLLGLDPPSTALDATEVIWQFFASHPGSQNPAASRAPPMTAAFRSGRGGTARWDCAVGLRIGPTNADLGPAQRLRHRSQQVGRWMTYTPSKTSAFPISGSAVRLTIQQS